MNFINKDQPAYIAVKRLLALLKTQAEKLADGEEMELDVPEGFKESFEHQKYFKGWASYHVTWDVTREDPWTVVPRSRSLEAEWQAELARVVPVINSDGTIGQPIPLNEE